MNPNEPILTTFHREWGKAHDAPDYDKAAWMRMQPIVEGYSQRLKSLLDWIASAKLYLRDECPPGYGPLLRDALLEDRITDEKGTIKRREDGSV